MVKHGILHVHSEFSIHDSTQSPEDIVKRASEIGCKNITLTDHGSLLGVDDFMDAGKKYGVNTIPGVEMYLEDRLHLVMVAKNYTGFCEISKALKKANENQFITKIKGKSFVYPILTKEVLEELKGSNNIVVSSACVQGPVCYPMLKQFYMSEKNKKIQVKMSELTEDVEKYHKYIEEIKKLEDEIKLYRNDKKPLVKYTTDSYERQIGKKEQKLSQLKEEISTLEKSENQKDISKAVKKKEKVYELKNDISQMKEVRRVSMISVQQLQKRIDDHTNYKKECMKKRDEFAKGKKKYDALKKKLLSDPSTSGYFSD